MPTFESRNRHRRITAALGALGALALVVACTPETKPAPEPTGFATEEEALEAARETFESYVEATNAVDFSDPESAEPVYAWLTGDALASERESVTTSHAEERERSGMAVVTLTEPAEMDLDVPTVTLNSCVDVSDVEIHDASGESVVSEDRLPVQPVVVVLVSSDTTPTQLAIQTLDGREGDPKCDSA